MVPIVNQLAEKLAAAGVRVGKVNALTDTEASDQLGLTGFPAFVLCVILPLSIMEFYFMSLHNSTMRSCHSIIFCNSLFPPIIVLTWRHFVVL